MQKNEGRIVTFYSYKGGTGRSMALANVAWLLASNGCRVLVVDWDLEAPGLHRYFRPFLADPELTGHASQGIIDFMLDFSVRLTTPPGEGQERAGEWFAPYADISKWSKRLCWPGGEALSFPHRGGIDFVPAGRQGPQYAKRVNSFDWNAFYERFNGGAFLDAVRRSMHVYDWVLIDSRTGVSDTAGICTLQFPDVLVVCFTLNFQSIDGSAAVAASVRAAKPGIRILPVPMRIDGSEDKLLQRMKAYARQAFSSVVDPSIDKEYWRVMEVPYFARYAYFEKLAPFEEQVSISTSTLPAVERLAAYITEGKVSALQPLPEEHRKAALQEFERVPGEPEPPLEAPAASRIVAVGPEPRRPEAFQSWRTPPAFSMWKWMLPAGLAILGLLAVLYGLWRPKSDPITLLLRDTGRDLAAETPAGRNHAALLLAEAAARFTEQAAQSPTTTLASVPSGRSILDTLLRLQPLRAGSIMQKGPVNVVRFSPDGQFVATAGDDHNANLFRADGQPMAESWAAPNAGRAIAFSPDGHYLASGGPDGVSHIFELPSLAEVARLPERPPVPMEVNAVAFSPDGRLFAAGTDHRDVLVYSVDPWKQVAGFREDGGVLSLAFSPDSLYVAAGTMNPIAHFWAPRAAARATRAGAAPGKEPQDAAQSGAAPSGTAQSEAARLDVARSGGARSGTASAAGAPAGRNLPAGPAEFLGPHGGPVRHVAFAPSTNPRRLATASTDGHVRLWTQTAGNAQVLDLATGSDVYAIAFSPDGSMLAAGNQAGKALVWSVPDGKLIGEADLPADVRAVAFSSDHRWLATGSGDGTARIWEAPAMRELQRVSFNREVNAVAFSPDNRYLATAGTDRLAAAWLIAIPGLPLALTGSQAVTLACIQAQGSPALTDTEWRHYFGSQPFRPACSPAPPTGR